MLVRNKFASRGQGQRSGNRLRLAMPGELELTRGSHACLVENISSSGARVQLDAPLSVDCPVILHVAERAIFASVVWNGPNRNGLRFARLLPQEEMLRFLWIIENREEYERDRASRAALEWSTGRFSDIA